MPRSASRSPPKERDAAPGEHLLHLPEDIDKARAIAGGDGNWRLLFTELWAVRHRFLPSPAAAAPAAPETSRLMAYCRVRPHAYDDSSAASPQAARVALPLHQRVALLRRGDPGLSQREAVQRLMSGAEVAGLCTLNVHVCVCV